MGWWSSTGWELSTGEGTWEETQGNGSGDGIHRGRMLGPLAQGGGSKCKQLRTVHALKIYQQCRENLWLLDSFSSLSRGQGKKKNLKAKFSYQFIKLIKHLACCVLWAVSGGSAVPFLHTACRRNSFPPQQISDVVESPESSLQPSGNEDSTPCKKDEHTEGQEWYWPVWLIKILQEPPPVFNLVWIYIFSGLQQQKSCFL